MHLEEYTISRGVRVRDILFANLLDTPDAKEFLVPRCESQHEIHIYAKRVARLSLVPSASYLYIAADSVISCTAIPLKVDGRFGFRARINSIFSDLSKDLIIRETREFVRENVRKGIPRMPNDMATSST